MGGDRIGNPLFELLYSTVLLPKFLLLLGIELHVYLQGCTSPIRKPARRDLIVIVGLEGLAPLAGLGSLGGLGPCISLSLVRAN
jgi:hypothetical protein